MRTLLENLRENQRAESLRDVKCAGRYIVNDIGQAIAEIKRLRSELADLHAACDALNKSRASA